MRIASHEDFPPRASASRYAESFRNRNAGKMSDWSGIVESVSADGRSRKRQSRKGPKRLWHDVSTRG
jgi:hypothetical protein